MPPLAPRAVGFVVENPSMVEAAADAGLAHRPVVCSAGQPTVAVRVALRQLGALGAQLLQHADFDPSGIAITNWLRTHAGTTPWLMGATDYESAAGRLGAAAPRLTGAVPDTPWDPALAPAMTEHGRVVSEEHVRHDLLDAIGQAGA